MKNQFRAAIAAGQVGARTEPLMAEKASQDARAGDTLSVTIPRWEERHADHRDADRHRLGDELALVRQRGREWPARLVNLSGGGAMIEAEGFTPRLHEVVELVLGEEGTVDCAVRWLRDGRIGLEFAHETRLDCSEDERLAILEQVVRRHFDGQRIDLDPPPAPLHEELAPPAPPPGDSGQRGERRHPLIWNALLVFDHDRHPVRLRNVSATGAMAEGPGPFGVEDLVYVDLGPAGERLATVCWRRGDQAGLKFVEPIDITQLARCSTDTVPLKWKKPGWLDAHDRPVDPWDDSWKRMSLEDIRDRLEGFLKH